MISGNHHDIGVIFTLFYDDDARSTYAITTSFQRYNMSISVSQIPSNSIVIVNSFGAATTET